MAFGGAGPLHASIAQDLGMPTVIVPPTPGVTSALGILQVDLRHDLLENLFQRALGAGGRARAPGPAIGRLDEATAALKQRDASVQRGTSSARSTCATSARSPAI